jgi:hypothetical protein
MVKNNELDPFPPMSWGASPPDQDIIIGFAYLPSSQLALITVIAGQRCGVCGMGITARACPWSRAEPTQITTSNI